MTDFKNQEELTSPKCWLMDCATYSELDCKKQADGNVRGTPTCWCVDMDPPRSPFSVDIDTACPFPEQREPSSWYL